MNLYFGSNKPKLNEKKCYLFHNTSESFKINNTRLFGCLFVEKLRFSCWNTVTEFRENE